MRAAMVGPGSASGGEGAAAGVKAADANSPCAISNPRAALGAADGVHCMGTVQGVSYQSADVLSL